MLLTSRATCVDHMVLHVGVLVCHVITFFSVPEPESVATYSHMRNIYNSTPWLQLTRFNEYIIE